LAQAFEVFFPMLRVTDEGNDDLLFFADDDGAPSLKT
jgi:hypothetical protein